MLSSPVAIDVEIHAARRIGEPAPIAHHVHDNRRGHTAKTFIGKPNPILVCACSLPGLHVSVAIAIVVHTVGTDFGGGRIYRRIKVVTVISSFAGI
jgi:hypothetical protein